MAPSQRIAVTFSHNILVFKAFYSISNAQPPSVIQTLNDILLKPRFFLVLSGLCFQWFLKLDLGEEWKLPRGEETPVCQVKSLCFKLGLVSLNKLSCLIWGEKEL